MAPRKILITGATGQQGGAALQALIANPPPFDHQILALTRNTSSPKAQALSKHASVELISGDLEDCPAIFSSAGGPNSIWGVFLVTVPDMNKKGGIDKEEASRLCVSGRSYCEWGQTSCLHIGRSRWTSPI